MLFSDLFHQGRFAVPWHQRYYDWKPSDVQALLHDIEDAIKEERDCYFLGAIAGRDRTPTVGNQRWSTKDGNGIINVRRTLSPICTRSKGFSTGRARTTDAFRSRCQQRMDDGRR